MDLNRILKPQFNYYLYQSIRGWILCFGIEYEQVEQNPVLSHQACWKMIAIIASALQVFMPVQHLNFFWCRALALNKNNLSFPFCIILHLLVNYAMKIDRRLHMSLTY